MDDKLDIRILNKTARTGHFSTSGLSSNRSRRLFYQGVTMSKKIPLTQGQFAIVDDEDYTEISKWKWSAGKTPYTYYAQRGLLREGKWTTMRMHCQILNTKKGEDVDHKDHNGLNNTRGNLRLCTRSQNLSNRTPKKGCSSKYKGVSWAKKQQKWSAQIGFNKKIKNIGRFGNEIEAARAYDEAANELFGEFACTNF